jgi:hypothetical protein
MGNCIGISVDVYEPEEIEEIEMSIQNEKEDSISSLRSEEYDEIERAIDEFLEEQEQDKLEQWVDELLENN